MLVLLIRLQVLLIVGLSFLFFISDSSRQWTLYLSVVCSGLIFLRPKLSFLGSNSLLRINMWFESGLISIDLFIERLVVKNGIPHMLNLIILNLLYKLMQMRMNLLLNDHERIANIHRRLPNPPVLTLQTPDQKWLNQILRSELLLQTKHQ
jgi:hypothetical protein